MTSIWDNILNIAGTDSKAQDIKEKPLGTKKDEGKKSRF